MHTSGISQKLISEILNVWNKEGESFEHHVEKVCQFYKSQRNLFHQIASLKIGDLAQWNLPAAGMFFWLKITGFEDTEKLISHSANTHKVLLVPGKVNCREEKTSKYL